MKTRFEYVVYNRKESQRLGVLPDVVSDFGYSQLINTPGTSMQIVVGIDPSFDRLPPDYLMTEAGEYLTTESGDRITTEEHRPIFDRFRNFSAEDTNPDPYYYNYSSSNQPPLIRNGNFVKVFEYSDRNPNGLQVFEGEMKRVRLSYSKKRIEITVLSFGYTTKHYLIRGIGTPDQENYSSDASSEIYYTDATHKPSFGQSFTTGTTVTNLFSITVRCAAVSSDGAPLNVNVYSDASFGSFVGNGQVFVEDTSEHDEEVLILPDSGGATVTPSTAYYFSVDTNFSQSQGIIIYYKSGCNSYTGGTMYVSTTDPASFSAVPSGIYPANSDLYFYTSYTDNASATAGHVTKDQGAIFLSIITDYIARWDSLLDKVFGKMSPGVIENTGTSYRYDWNTSTTLEGLYKQRKLAPADYYWYGSPADSRLHFRQTSTTADHVFIKGRHLGDVDLEFSTEDVVNVAVLTGGEDPNVPGSNLYRTKDNKLSRSNHPPGLVTLTDNRITTDDTATAYMDNALGQNPTEVQSSQIEIFEDTYDINTIELGHTVSLLGQNTITANSLIQIVGKQRKRTSVVLNLGQNPTRQNEITEKAIRDLDNVQTLNNPSEVTTPE